MGGRAVLICTALLIGVVIAENTTQQITARSLEPQGTSYHPLRHHQRPKDLSKLRYFSGHLDDDDNENAENIEDRRGGQGGRSRPGGRDHPSYFAPHRPSTTMSPMGSGSYGHGNHGSHGGGSTGPSGPGGYGPDSMRPENPNRRNALKTIYGWTEIDFTWPSPQARRQAIDSGAFQPHNIIPLDVDVYHHNGNKKIFVTMPRGDGVPVALATVSSEGKRKSPRLAPYPDWSWHGNGTCDGISSVYRIQVDECGRLWVLDRGDDKLCTPQLLLFDLKNDLLISRYRIPTNLLRNGTNLITIAVDIRNGKCGEAFAYIADVLGGMIVFDARREESWRIEHPSFKPIIEFATYRIAGREFYLTDGLFGLGLGPLHRGERMLYYHPLASVYESWVPTSVLRRKENFYNGQNLVPHQFHTSRAHRPSQSAAQVMDSDGTLFSGLLSETSVTCWNSDLEFGGWNLAIVATDEEALQFPSGMKIHNGQIWIMTSRYQNFATDTMDWNDINYRILTGRVEDLTRGTMCDPKSTSAINSLG